MSTFNRGLDEAFVQALNEQYDADNGWWRQFVNDKDLFLAIRDNAVHVYYRGCRLIEVAWRNDKIVANTHYKYLLLSKQEYVDVVGGKPSIGDASAYFARKLDVVELKAAATVYAGDEKTGVHEILRRNRHILDVEIAISDGEKAPRIDFAALQEGGDARTHIVFYEAKHFDNKELRSKSGKAPVVEQIDRYRGLLEQHRESIEESYRRIFENLFALKGIPERQPDRHPSLVVEKDPGLVVFGFDGDQKVGKFWARHKRCLEQHVRKERLLLYGDPAKVRVPTTEKASM